MRNYAECFELYSPFNIIHELLQNNIVEPSVDEFLKKHESILKKTSK